MGAGYRTAKPQFIDHIYQPDQNLQLALAKADIEEDALTKSLASNSDLGVNPTFKAWEGDMEEEVNNLNQEIEPLVQELLEEGTNSRTIRKLNDITRKAQDNYSTGPIGKMSSEYDKWNSTYSELLDNAKKIKDDGERAAEMSRLSKYRGYVGQQAKQKGPSDFGYSGYSNFTSPDSFLEENLDAEKLKVSQTYLKREAAPMVDGEVLSESQMKKLGVQYVPSENAYYMPNGVDSQGKPKWEDITAKSDSIEWKEHFPFSYDAMSIKEEGYDLDTIRNMSASMLYNNQAVVNMLRQDYNDFEEKQYINEKGNIVTAKNEDEYIAGKINQQANNYAKRFSGTTREESLVNRKDTAGRHAWEARFDQSLAINKDTPPLLTTRFDGKSSVFNTPEGIKGYMNYRDELRSYIDGNIVKLSQVIEDMPNLTAEAWNNLSPEAKEEVRVDTMNSIQSIPKNSKVYQDINAIEQKFVDLTEYGMQEVLDKLDGVPPQHKQSVIDGMAESLNDTDTKIEVAQRSGSWQVGDNWLGLKGKARNKDNFNLAETAKGYSDQELIGQPYNGEGYKDYVIVGVGSREDSKVNPRDYESDTESGLVKANGVVVHTQLKLVPKEIYQKYEEGGSIQDKITGEVTPVTSEMLEDRAETVPATKYVSDYVVDFNISY